MSLSVIGFDFMVNGVGVAMPTMLMQKMGWGIVSKLYSIHARISTLEKIPLPK